ncbi:DUF192 domain-containing protein [Litchfieldia alkalitelluris]|uniref:DUF192 domain-containing protein n=1 Tax=Litchfieldia alkalitelluris TaxID=304268 RepID=UPI0009967D01|nr:DUF192 domain-containing protein [Litchfieldia alkalitelluris]
MELYNLSNQTVIADNVGRAYSFIKRLKGLMFTKTLNSGTGLHIKPCLSVHTFFMKYPIDILYLNQNNEIVALDQAMSPGKVGKVYRDVQSVIELPAGTIEQMKIEINQIIKLT